MATTSPDRRRLIDSLPMPSNPRKMQVFVVGLCRTGTTTMRVALSEFGYNGHGMSNVREDAHGKYWSEAVRLKYRTDDPSNAGLKPYGPAEFQKLLAGYDAVTDLPGVLFVDEIRQAFPDAKVVVTNRDVKSWQKSMDLTILAMMRWKLFLPLARVQGGSILEAVHCIYDSVSQVGGDPSAYLSDERMVDGFHTHYEHLRQTIPADQRLEYSVCDGWEPLCKFLGLDVPDRPFPHVNDSEEFMEVFRGIWWTLFGVAAAKAVVVGGVLGYGGLLAARHFQRTSR